MRITVFQMFVALLLLGIGYAFMSWQDARLEAQVAAYEKYETCVLERAGMTVTDYYQRYGYAPECN